MKKLTLGGMTAVLLAVSCQASEAGTNEVDAIALRLQESVQKGEITKREAVLELESLARKYRDLVDANKDSFDFRRCQSALKALHGFDDKHSLPLFEEMTESVHFVLRYYGMVGYVRVAGVVDALPFIESLVKKPHVAGYYYPAYMTLIAIAYNEHILLKEIYRHEPHPPAPESKLSPTERKKVFTFMLEKVQVENESVVKLLDETLSKHLPRYATSIQRMEVVERLAKSDKVNFSGERISDYWKPIKEEIEKTPANERKDFRAKGELLDPERKEE